MPASTLSISLSNVAGALHRPKLRTRNCHNPWLVQKAVFGLASGLRGTCQYLLCRSSEENQDELDTRSSDSSMQGSGLSEGSMMPAHSISSIALSVASRCAMGRRRRRNLMCRESPVSICAAPGVSDPLRCLSEQKCP